jgi:transposase
MKKTAVIRPSCPRCGMQMIVVKGARLEPHQKTFECLRCGHVATSTSHPTDGGANR